STEQPEAIDPKALTIDPRWVRPPRVLSAAAGPHRFVWDLRYPPPEGGPRTYPISAVYRDTPGEPLGPAVLPGTYTVKLTGGGRASPGPGRSWGGCWSSSRRPTRPRRRRPRRASPPPGRNSTACSPAGRRCGRRTCRG